MNSMFKSGLVVRNYLSKCSIRYNSIAVPSRLPIVASKLDDKDKFDSLVIVANDLDRDLGRISQLNEHFAHLKTIKEHTTDFDKDLTYTISNNKRLIYSPTGPLNRDYDDVRRVGEATEKAVKKAIKIGSKKPLLINAVKSSPFQLSDHVSLLSALQASYIPLEVREAKPSANFLKVENLGYWHANPKEAARLIDVVNATEIGRIVARDIGGSDPERMAAANILAYVNEIFKSTDINISIVEGQEQFKKNYPCFAAVNRAANAVERHQGRIIKLEYNPGKQIDKTLFLVGKGVTYDTGGADIKHGGNMAGMHRDKCGAAFVAGFFKSLSLLKPKGLKVVGYLCLVRNSVGEECYVSDEIITARSKKRIRIANTDAEGRMAICDLLNESKDLALNETNPELFTIATLTGHVLRCYGTNYTAIMSNGPARSKLIDSELQQSGELIADPYEISRIRKEDYEHHKSKSEYEDIVQANTKPSVAGARGHQGPAAFLIMASGLDQHGVDSKQPLAYSHIDIAGSCGKYPGLPSAAPLPSFIYNYVLPKL